MRILVITHYLPWPLNSGGNAAQFSTLKCLAQDHQFTVVCVLQKAEQLALPAVRFVGVPNDSSAPGRNRFFRSARKLYRWVREFFLAPASTSAPLPFYPFDLVSPGLLATVTAELAKGVDLCQVEYAELLTLGPWLPAGIPKIFIHPQIHYVYVQRFIEARGNANGYSSYMEAVIRAQEIAYLKFFQTIVTFSREDQKILQALALGGKVVSSPFPLPADVQIPERIPDAFNGTFFFLASEAHSANRDALEWMLAAIWPTIVKTLPDAKLQIVGEWTEKSRAEKSGPTVAFTGFVEDLSKTLSGGVMLVPVRIGSGIRVKILIALALGVPVVSTTIGNEGIDVADGKEVLLRDDPASFAAAAIELARNPTLWRSLAAAGKEVVQKNYAPETVRRQRNEIYAELRARHAASKP